MTVPAIRKGADIRTADDEWMRYLEMQKSTAVTFGDIIILRPDATTSEVLEETKLLQEFYRNKKERLKREGEWID